MIICCTIFGVMEEEEEAEGAGINVSATKAVSEEGAPIIV